MRRLHIKEPSRHHTCKRQIKHRRVKAVHHHGQRAVEFFFQQSHGRMHFGVDKDRIFKEITVEHSLNREIADNHRGNSEQNQRQGDHPRAFVRIVVFTQAVVCFFAVIIMMMFDFTPFLFAVKHHEILAESIKCRHKHAGEHRKIGKAAAGQGAGMCRFNDGIFGIKA